jgi:HEAT repeat protein
MTGRRLARITFYGGSGLIFLYVLINPYTRQGIFGPRVGGEPLCYWQQQIRHANAAGGGEPLMARVLAWLGLKSEERGEPGVRADRLTVWLSLKEDTDPNMRAAVARELGSFHDYPDAFDGLLQLLDDPDSDVRAAAAEGCWRLHWMLGPEAARAVSKLRPLFDHPSELCRVHAATVVLNAAEPRDAQARTVLLEGLKSSDSVARAEAIRSLCKVGKESPQAFAEVAMAAQQDLVSRQMFAWHAGGFGKLAVPLLAKLLGDGDFTVRHGAFRSLGDIGPDAVSAVPALVRVRDNATGGTRTAAMEALSRIDPERYPDKGAAD